MPVELLEKRAAIKNTELSEGRQMDFYGGGKVLLEGYTTRAGYKRDAYIQIDAAERNFEFTYDGLDRKRYQAENRAIHTQQRAARGEREAKEMGKAPELTIHHMILKAAVPDEAYKQWSEAVKDPSKRADVKAFYIKGMSRTVRANLSTHGSSPISRLVRWTSSNGTPTVPSGRAPR